MLASNLRHIFCISLNLLFPQKLFNPANNRTAPGINNGANTTIELQVTNLDQNIDTKDMKRILSSVFSEHVTVCMHLSHFS